MSTVPLGFETWPMDPKNNRAELMFVFWQDFIYLIFRNAKCESPLSNSEGCN